MRLIRLRRALAAVLAAIALSMAGAAPAAADTQVSHFPITFTFYALPCFGENILVTGEAIIVNVRQSDPTGANLSVDVSVNTALVGTGQDSQSTYHGVVTRVFIAFGQEIGSDLVVAQFMILNNAVLTAQGGGGSSIAHGSVHFIVTPQQGELTPIRVDFERCTA